MAVRIQILRLKYLYVLIKNLQLEFVRLAGLALNLLDIAAFVERVFSKLKILQLMRKIQLKMVTVSNLVIIKCNVEEDCKRFYEKNKNNKSTLEKK